MAIEQFNVARINNRARAARIVGLPLSLMGDEQFALLQSKKKQREILGPMPKSGIPPKRPFVRGGMTPYIASLYEVQLLTREQEAHLFRKMNYLKYLARQLREMLDLDQPMGRLMDRIEVLYEESVSIKNQIIRANLRLVVSIAKRYIGPAELFFELVSDGNMSLMRAAEKFDVSLGNKFSTYASWAIIKNFARTISVAIRQRDRFRTSHSEVFVAVEDFRANQSEQNSSKLGHESDIQVFLNRLDKRERQIIEDRFGLIHGRQPQTLKQIAATMGVSKERIRQIANRTIGKMRKAAKNGELDINRSSAKSLPRTRHANPAGDCNCIEPAKASSMAPPLQPNINFANSTKRSGRPLLLYLSGVQLIWRRRDCSRPKQSDD